MTPMSQPMGPDPSGNREYVEERAIERDREEQLELAREAHEATADEPKKPSFWRRLFGKD